MGSSKFLGLKNILITGITSTILGCGCQPADSSSNSPKPEELKLGNRWYNENLSSEDQYIEDFAGINMKMIWIPGGDVEIYRDSNGKTLVDFVEGFWMGETEVSVDQLLKIFEKDTGYNPKQDTQRGEGGSPKDIRNPELPASNISFLNAKRFVDYLSVRTGRDYFLPTCSEWILACRGPKMPLDGFYGSINRDTANVWFDSETLTNKAPPILNVKHLKPNKYGLYGMLGNVKEFLIVPQDSVFFNPDWLKDNNRFKEGLIALTPGTHWESCDLTDPSKNSSYPKIHHKVYEYSDLFFSPYTGFRVIRRPSKNN